MEEQEVKLITGALPQLLESTICNAIFIAELKTRNMLGPADVADLECKQNRMEKNGRLYDILKTRVDGFRHLKESLLKTGQSGVLKLLGETIRSAELMDTSMQARQPMFFNVYPPTDYFTGREKELAQLEATLQGEENLTIISSKSCITGLGGIGKTDLARKFIQNLSKHNGLVRYEHIIWINAENHMLAEKDLKVLAVDKFGLSIFSGPGQEKDISTILDDIYSLLSTQYSLIIFDNVIHAEFVQKYLPKAPHYSTKIRILITSQDHNWNIGAQIYLSGLEENDAVKFVRMGLAGLFVDDSQFQNDTLQLVSRLEFFPLAIAQAIAFVKERKKIRKNYGPREYLHDLDNRTQIVLKKLGPNISNCYSKSTFETLIMTFEKLNQYEETGKIALRLIKLMAFMAPDNIEDTFFETLDGVDEFLLEEALLLLSRFSIVNFCPREEGCPLNVNIHRLVQHVMRCVVESERETLSVLHEALSLLDSNINFSMVDHGLALWRYAISAKELIVKHFSIIEKIFWILRYQTRLNDAFRFVEFSLSAISEQFKFEENMDLILQQKLIFAEALDMLGRSSNHGDYVHQTLQLGLVYKKGTDFNILRLRRLKELQNNHLYVYLEDTQRNKQLENLFNLYKDWKSVLGFEENLESLQVLSFIAERQRFLKQYKESISTSEKLLAAIDTLKLTGVEKARLYNLKMGATRDMASALMHMGNISKALHLQEEILSDIESQKAEHFRLLRYVRVAISLSSLYLGDFRKSVENGQLVVDASIKHFGRNNFYTLVDMLNLCLAKSELENTSPDLENYLVLFNEEKQNLGENSKITKLILVVQGKIFQSLGKHVDALSVFENTLQDKELLGMLDMYETCIFRHSYLVCLLKSGQVGKAKKLVQQLKYDLQATTDEFYIKSKVLQIFDDVAIFTSV